MTPIAASALDAVRGGAEVVPEPPATCAFYMREADSFGAAAEALQRQYTDGKIHMDVVSMRDQAMNYARASDKCWTAQPKP